MCGAGRGIDFMDEEAFVALEAIGQSGRAETEHEPWVKAFKAIRWVVQTETGLALTPAGRVARDEIAARRQSASPSDDRRDGAGSHETAPGK